MDLDMRWNTTEYLVDRFLNDLVRFSLIYVKNKEDAQDIAQQVFVTYLQRKPVFENETHAKRWLLKVAVNCAKNMLRSKARDDVSFDDICAVLPAEQKESEKTARDTAVFAAVMRLNRIYREVIHLYYYEDYTTEEIARLLHLSHGTVRTRLSRARQALENDLKGGLFGDET